VRALIRNTLEDLLIKPPFYTKKIIDELLEDIAEAAPALNTREKVKRYVESRYLSRLKPEVELSIYRSLWKERKTIIVMFPRGRSLWIV
jgi:hypothetical protein